MPQILGYLQPLLHPSKIVLTEQLWKIHKTINVLTKGEEQENLLINLISQIDNLELKEEYLKKLKKTMIKEEKDKRIKTKISLDETLEGFNKKKSKEITVND